MRKLRLLSLLSLSLSFLTISCTKEGPEGPAGSAGTQGPAGSNGAQGTPGAGITTYSAWFSTVAADWTDSYEPPYWALFGFNKTAPGITQAIIDNGIVLSYIKNWTYYDLDTDGPLKIGNVTAQLPFMADIDFADLYDFVVPSVGNIKYLYKSGNQTWPPSELAGTAFRYVIIAGSVAGGRGIDNVVTYGGYTKEELKAMPYDQVASLFNIPTEGTNIP